MRRTLVVEGSNCLTHREIGALLGISSARVQQIEAAALLKLKRLLDARGLTFDSLAPEQELPKVRR